MFYNCCWSVLFKYVLLVKVTFTWFLCLFCTIHFVEHLYTVHLFEHFGLTLTFQEITGDDRFVITKGPAPQLSEVQCSNKQLILLLACYTSLVSRVLRTIYRFISNCWLEEITPLSLLISISHVQLVCRKLE